ncbi:hypothetical protein RIF29_30448 [Crotalaria pallida]|uniref:CBM20 domain-containing protein n=1 Tax=Crotalaria pallida TaxID=3830 RepID=A0AAN9EIJ0_CROPI
MAALTSSCPKATVARLGSYYPRGAAFVSDRPQICFSSNEKKGCNIQFLKLVSNKGIYPIHAVSSEPQSMLERDLDMDMDMDTVEFISEKTNEKSIHVKFQLQKNCDFGEQFFIVGDDPMFGSWNPSNALPMTWSDGHVWTYQLNIPAGKSIQFKFILKGKTGELIWQPGPDRILHTWEAMDRVTVCEDWENAGSQKIIQEYQLALSNEEPKINSNMPTFGDEMVPNATKLSGLEVSQTHAKEKPLLTAGKIGSPDEIIKNANHRMTTRKLIHKNEKSAKSLGNDVEMHHLSHNGKAAPINNQERI